MFVMRERRPADNKTPLTEFETFEHFLMSGQVPHGRFAIPYHDSPVDFLYDPVEGAQTTVVFFHGSTKRDVSLPSHTGAGIMSGLPANRLAISDPSITLDDSHDLILSWFLGSRRQPNLQYFLETVIRRVVEVTGARRLIFMGSSGGGFASLEMSRRFPNSLALVMNPQIVLSDYHQHLVKRYLELCWDGAESFADLTGYGVADLTQVYGPVLNHTVAYIQNTRDDHHVKNHQIPFFEKAGASRRVLMLMDAWGDPEGKGHVVPPSHVLKNILDQLLKCNGAWWKCLVGLGFDYQTTPDTVRSAVQVANQGLPKQKVKDTM